MVSHLSFIATALFDYIKVKSMSIPVLRLEENTKGNDYVFGDLHGMKSSLDELLSHVDFNPAVDRLISVGDLVDRGEDGKGAGSFESLSLLKETYFYATVGNHEIRMLSLADKLKRHGVTMDLLKELAFYRSESNWVKDLYVENKKVFDSEFSELVKLAKKLPYVIVVGEGDNRFNVVHAELRIDDFGYFHDSDIDNDFTMVKHTLIDEEQRRQRAQYEGKQKNIKEEDSAEVKELMDELDKYDTSIGREKPKEYFTRHFKPENLIMNSLVESRKLAQQVGTGEDTSITKEDGLLKGLSVTYCGHNPLTDPTVHRGGKHVLVRGSHVLLDTGASFQEEVKGHCEGLTLVNATTGYMYFYNNVHQRVEHKGNIKDFLNKETSTFSMKSKRGM